MRPIQFERGENGDVVVSFGNQRIVVPKDHWHSAIAQVSYYGEEDYGFYRAAEFHSGTPIHETCPLKQKPQLW